MTFKSNYHLSQINILSEKCPLCLKKIDTSLEIYLCQNCFNKLSAELLLAIEKKQLSPNAKIFEIINNKMRSNKIKKLLA